MLSIDWLIDLRPCQHDNGYMDGRSPIESTPTNGRRFTALGLTVTYPSTNRAGRNLTSVTESPSKHWSPPRTFNVAT